MREIFYKGRGWACTKLGGYRVFCNPPYGKEIKKWVEKAYREGCKDNTLVVLLIPARTDTHYFHDYILHRAEIRFMPGRIKFGDSLTAAPFPSMLVIFRGARVRTETSNEKTEDEMTGQLNIFDYLSYQ